MKKFAAGLTVGIAISLSVTALAASVKEYILKDASYPVLVNGVEYKDKEYPILEYNGRTYIPLSKIGDLTGVNYIWNAEKHRVEIHTDTSGKAANSSTGKSSNSVKQAEEEQDTLRGPSLIIGPDGNLIKRETTLLVDFDGVTFLEAYNMKGEYVGRYSDEDDSTLVISRIQRKPVLPPKLSEGWVQNDLFERIFGLDIEIKGNQVVFQTHPFVYEQKQFLRLTLPDQWNNDSAESNNVRIKRYRIDNSKEITDTWIDDATLAQKTNIKRYPETSVLDYYFYVPTEKGNLEKRFNFQIPEYWDSTKDIEETSINGLRMKKEDGKTYFYVEDLKRLDIIPGTTGSHNYDYYFNLIDLKKAGLMK